MLLLPRAARRGVFLAAILAAAPLRAEPSGEQPRFVRFQYTLGPGAEQCPGQAVLASAVSTRLGYDPFREDAPRSVAAAVQVSGGSLEGTVTMTDTAGTVIGARRLSAARDDCDELVASMALAISVAVDPELALRAGPAPAPAPPPPPPAIVPGPAPRPIPAELPPPSLAADPLPALPEPPPPAPVPGFHVGAGAVVAMGTLPRAAGGFVAEGGVRYRALGASVEARALLPARQAAPGGGSVEAALYTGSVVPCWHVHAVVAACALGSFGAIRGVGAGVAQPRQDVTPFVAFGLRLGAEVPLGRVFSVGLRGEVSAPITRTTLQLGGRDVWTSPPASAAIGALLLSHFR